MVLTRPMRVTPSSSDWRWRSAFLVAAMILAPVACEDRAAPAGAPSATASAAVGVPIGLTLTPDEEGRAQAMADSLGEYARDFSPEEVAEPKNAPRFLWLAAHAPRKPVVCAALSALRSAGAREGRKLPAQDVCRVVSHHLGSSDPEIAALAVQATFALRDGSCPTAIDRVVEIARHPDPGMRCVAVDELCYLRGARELPQVVATYARAVADPAPGVAAMALFRIATCGAWARSEELLAAARPQLRHPEPGVRGLAADVVVCLGRENPWVVEELLRLLEDAHPYVRAAAAEGLGSLDDPSVIHALILRVDDHEGSRYSLPVKLPTGNSESMAYQAGPYNQVRDEVLRAIAGASRKLQSPFELVEGEIRKRRQEQAKAKGPLGLQGLGPTAGGGPLTRPSARQMDATLDERSARAKRWYAAQRAKLPPLRSQPAK
jgi:hypothetical protein